MPFVDLFRKIHRVFFVVYVEGNLPFIAINKGTCGVKKRSTKNNGHAPILGDVKHKKIGKYEAVGNFNRNILTNTDFVVLDMPEDGSMPIILGRPFLNTAGAFI